MTAPRSVAEMRAAGWTVDARGHLRPPARSTATVRAPRLLAELLYERARVAPGGVLVATAAVRLAPENNQREHWSATHARKKAQQRAVALALLGAPPTAPGPWRVRLVRLFPATCRPLDPGNLEASFKHVQDGVAKWLGVDDGDRARVGFAYDQARAAGHGVRIEIAPAGAGRDGA